MEKEKLVKALENYFEDCKFRKRLNNKTIKAYKIDLNQFFEIVNNLDDEVKEINEYIHFLNKKYSKHKTVKRKLASVKAFYSYLEYEEIIEYFLLGPERSISLPSSTVTLAFQTVPVALI